MSGQQRGAGAITRAFFMAADADGDGVRIPFQIRENSFSVTERMLTLL